MNARKGIEFINRVQIAGFKEYFSQRSEHFRDIYHYEFTDEAACVAHKESMALVQKCRSGDSGTML